jgi:hypothetical protein
MPSRRPAGAPPGSLPRGAVPTRCSSPIRRAAVPGCGGFHAGECEREPNAQRDPSCCRSESLRSPRRGTGAPGMSPPPGVPGVRTIPARRKPRQIGAVTVHHDKALAGPAVPVCYLWEAVHINAVPEVGKSASGVCGIANGHAGRCISIRQNNALLSADPDVRRACSWIQITRFSVVSRWDLGDQAADQ